jgi:hypothetical protein
MRNTFLAAFICALPILGGEPSEPKAIAEHLYAHPDRVYSSPDARSLSPRYFTPRLVKLYRADQAGHKGEVPNLDFDFLSNSQDPEVSQVSAVATSQAADRQIITVRFLEMKEPQVLEFVFRRLDGTWLIDEVRCPMKGQEWTLSQILRGKP